MVNLTRTHNPAGWLWAAFLVPLVCWLLHLSLSFIYSAYLCSGRSGVWLHGMTAAALLISGGTVLMGWKMRGKSRSIFANPKLEKGALIAGCTFMVAILAGGIANILLEFCS